MQIQISEAAARPRRWRNGEASGQSKAQRRGRDSERKRIARLMERLSASGDIPPGELSVILLHLRLLRNGRGSWARGYAYIGKRKAAEMAGVSVDTVKRARARMAKMPEFQVSRGGGRGRATEVALAGSRPAEHRAEEPTQRPAAPVPAQPLTATAPTPPADVADELRRSTAAVQREFKLAWEEGCRDAARFGVRLEAEHARNCIRIARSRVASIVAERAEAGVV